MFERIKKYFNKQDNKKTWDDITLKDFYEIKNIMEIQDEYTIYNLIDYIYKVDSSKMDITELYKYSVDFLSEPIPVKNIKIKEKYTINGRKYISNVNLTKITCSQFIDFTNLVRQSPEEFEKLVSVFFIPEGHEYNDGYDMKEVQRDILQLPIAVVQAMSFFMMKEFQTYAVIFQLYLTEEITKMKNIPKEMKDEMEKIRMEVTRLACSPSLL